MSDFFKPASEAPEGAMIYTFYEDPGHGWLEVQTVELVELGIVGDITPYSYLKGTLAYLEEDCDLYSGPHSQDTNASRLRVQPFTHSCTALPRFCFCFYFFF
jgi:hypothetical protein